MAHRAWGWIGRYCGDRCRCAEQAIDIIVELLRRRIGGRLACPSTPPGGVLSSERARVDEYRFQGVLVSIGLQIIIEASRIDR